MQRTQDQLTVMSFGEHLEELRRRLLRALLVMGGAVVVALFFQGHIVEFLARPHQRVMADLALSGQASALQRELATINANLAAVSAAEGAMALASARTMAALRSDSRALRESLGGAADPRLGQLAGILDRLLALEEGGAWATLDEALVDVGGLADLPANRVPGAAAGAWPAVAAQAQALVECRRAWQKIPAAAHRPVSEEAARTLEWARRDLDQVLRRARELTLEGAPEAPLQLLRYTDSFKAHIFSAVLAGLLIGLPWLAFELWGFVAAGLYPAERRAVRPFLPISLLCMVLGVTFAYTVIAPVGLAYLGNYGASTLLETSFTISDYLSLIITLMLGMALVFQLPLVMVFASRAGLIEPEVFRRYRKYSILGALVVGAMLTPPDVVSQLLLAGPLILLYELGTWASTLMVRHDQARRKKGNP